eukprot:1161689-Pelagomonas_calceolata.AAC.2
MLHVQVSFVCRQASGPGTPSNADPDRRGMCANKGVMMSEGVMVSRSVETLYSVKRRITIIYMNPEASFNVGRVAKQATPNN